jgi:hypothetical protein
MQLQKYAINFSFLLLFLHLIITDFEKLTHIEQRSRDLFRGTDKTPDYYLHVSSVLGGLLSLTSPGFSLSPFPEISVSCVKDVETTKRKEGGRRVEL